MQPAIVRSVLDFRIIRSCREDVETVDTAYGPLDKWMLDPNQRVILLALLSILPPEDPGSSLRNTSRRMVRANER